MTALFLVVFAASLVVLTQMFGAVRHREGAVALRLTRRLGATRLSGAVKPKRGLQIGVAAVVALMPFVLSVPSALAGVGLSTVPNFTGPRTVGDVGKPASYTITNASNGAEAVGNLTLDSSMIFLTPSCGTAALSPDCPTAFADPGVFKLSLTGTGAAGSACAGTTFLIEPGPNNAVTGQVMFIPSAPVVLGPTSGTLSTCRIDFTFDVLKAPGKPLAGTGTSTQNPPKTAQHASAIGTHFDANPGGGVGTNTVIVNKANVAAFTTSATPSGLPGASITDTATITGAAAPAPAPSGTITFNLFGPSATPICNGEPVGSSARPVNGAGSYTSGAAAPTKLGTYYWVATYSGDTSYLPASTGCGDLREKTTVVPVPPAVTPMISVTKVATPLSLPAPSGTFTFTVQVSNPSGNDPVKITSLIDNVYGNLATRSGSTCGALIGVTLAPGAVSAPCSFTGPFAGVAGASQTDIVTVTGVDSQGIQVTNAAHAVVSLTPAPSVPTTVAPQASGVLPATRQPAPPTLAFTGNESSGRILLAAGLLSAAMAMLFVVGRRRMHRSS